MNKLKITKVGNTIKIEDTAPQSGTTDFPFNLSVATITKVTGTQVKRQGGGFQGGIDETKKNALLVSIYQETGTFAFTMDEVDTSFHTTWVNTPAGMNIAVAAIAAML